MAGDWMKIDLELSDKPEVHGIASMLNIDPDAVVGKLVRIWQWFDKHTVDGNAYGVTVALVDRLANVIGFGEAMMFVGWLEQHDKTLHMPKFDRHTSQSAKTRALGGKRQKKLRTKGDAESNGKSVTKSLPEKRREEVNLMSEQSPDKETASPPKPERRKHGSPEDREDAVWMFGLIRIVVPSAKEPNFDTWANDVRLMREQDKRTRLEIAELFRWANADSFWRTNILSPDKLREKWNALEAKRLSKPSRESVTADIFAGGL